MLIKQGVREGLAAAVAASKASGLLDVEDDEQEGVDEDAGEAAVAVPAE